MATIFSPRPWEPRLVDAVAETGLARLTARCSDFHEVPPVDALVVGSEAPRLDAAIICEVRRRGIAVVGIFPPGDRPAIEMFCRAGVDQLFVDAVDPILILRTVRDLTLQPVSMGQRSSRSPAARRLFRL